MISDEYRRQQAELHATGVYGVAGQSHGPAVSEMIRNTGAKTLLDYGCGSRRSLAQGLTGLPFDVVYEGYDPAVPEFSKEPDPAELVACIDVLEHIEPEHLDTVLDHLKAKTQKWLYATVHTKPAKKTLSDGRNAHLIQKNPDWWLPKMMERWELVLFKGSDNGFAVVMKTR